MDGGKCDFCGQPGIQLAGETNGVLVCIDHAAEVVTPRYTSNEVIERLCAERDEHQWNALEMARKADLATTRAEDAEAEVERLRDVLAEVRRVFDLQCPPMSADRYVDRGAWHAHSWWNRVLGSVIDREAQR